MRRFSLWSCHVSQFQGLNILFIARFEQWHFTCNSNYLIHSNEKSKSVCILSHFDAKFNSVCIISQKVKFCKKDFVSKCDQIWIWSHLLKKFLMKNFISCGVVLWHVQFEWYFTQLVSLINLQLSHKAYFGSCETRMVESFCDDG